MLNFHKYALATLALIGCICGGCTSVQQTKRDNQRLEARLNSTRDVMKAEFDLLMKLDDDVRVLRQKEGSRALHGKQ